MLHAVILAGGSGTRFWPASRQDRPKQVLPLLAGQTLVQATLTRLGSLVPRERTWLVAGQALVAALQRAAPDLPAAQVLVEPAARNTAPSILFAAARLEVLDPDATMAIMPADHALPDAARFRVLLAAAVRLAETQASLVTFGIVPDRPATGYGYLEAGAALPALDSVQVRRVAAFHEKPDLATAQAYVAGGRHYWNGGIFVWRLSTLFATVRERCPDQWPAVVALRQAVKGGTPAQVAAAFAALPATSIDYALMERAGNILMVEADLAWDDLGSFAALRRLGAGDAQGNVAVLSSGAEALFLAASRCAAYGEGAGMIVVSGVSDLVVVRVGDVTLVCPADRAEDVRKVVEELRRRGRGELL